MFMNLKGFANFSTKAFFVQKNVNYDFFIIQPCLFSYIKSLWSSICAAESNHVVQVSSHMPWIVKCKNPSEKGMWIAPREQLGLLNGLVKAELFREVKGS